MTAFWTTSTVFAPKITITALFKRQKGDLTMDKEEQTLDEFREEKRKKKAQMTAMQNLPYEIKVKRAAIRVREFIEKCDELGFNTHVSVGGA